MNLSKKNYTCIDKKKL